MIEVKLNAALEEINHNYVSGCIKYYSEQDPDPWMTELVKLEAMLSIGSVVEIKNSIDELEKGCKELIKKYRK